MRNLKMNLILGFLFVLLFSSCGKEEQPVTKDDFCSVTPEGWQCDFIEENFSVYDIPKDADNPIAIVKYINKNREFTKHTDVKVNPSLTLNLYPISKKEELIDFIISQQKFSWCIPVYYGETKEHFILTSPCYNNSGVSTDESNMAIHDLHEALKTILTKKAYSFTQG